MKTMQSIQGLLVLLLIGCGGGHIEKSYVYESEIGEKSPALFSQIAIYHLESPSGESPAGDSGELGSDRIHLAGDPAGARIFCLDLEDGQYHRAQIWADSQSAPVLIDSQNACATLQVPSGKVTVSLVHDGLSDAEDVFVYEANAASRAMVLERTALARGNAPAAENAAVLKAGAVSPVALSQEPSPAPMTIISATGCPSCNLENADLVGRDLRKMDFTGAKLRFANVSYSNLASADLLKADLTGLISEGANVSGAVWSDGAVCAATSSGICEPVTFNVHANRFWQETGVFLRSGRQVSITARGTWAFNPLQGTTGPSGDRRAIAKPGYPLPGAPEGALIGKVGKSAAFLVGDGATYRARESGELRMVINDDLEERYGTGLRNNAGTLQLTLHVSE
jgi:hypothetical protein